MNPVFKDEALVIFVGRTGLKMWGNIGEGEEEKRGKTEKEKMVEKLALNFSRFWRKSRSFSGGRSWCGVVVESKGEGARRYVLVAEKEGTCQQF